MASAFSEDDIAKMLKRLKRVPRRSRGWHRASTREPRTVGPEAGEDPASADRYEFVMLAVAEDCIMLHACEGTYPLLSEFRLPVPKADSE